MKGIMATDLLKRSGHFANLMGKPISKLPKSPDLKETLTFGDDLI